MGIVIDDQLLAAARMSEDEVKLELAVLLYQKEKLSLAMQPRAEAAALVLRKERVSEAGGHLLAAAFSFLGESLPCGASAVPEPQAVSSLRAGLQECVETAEDGKLRLAVTLPGMQSLDALASALAKLLAARESGAGAA